MSTVLIVLLFLLNTLFMPLAVELVKERACGLALRVIRLAVRLLPRAHRDRYREEWTAELDEMERQKVSQLVSSLRILLGAPSMGWILRVRDRRLGRYPTRRRLREKLVYQAYHDPLTALANRQRVTERLEQIFAGPADQRRVGLCFLDLDGFRVVNHSLGHDIGDQLLKTVASRLKGCCGPGQLVARTGGDEFVIIFEDTTGEADVVALAEKVLIAMAEPIRVGDHELNVTTSIGAVEQRVADTNPEDLLQAADITMYRAKADGKARYARYESIRPAGLPADTPYFVGRSTELCQLTDLLNSATQHGNTVVVSAIQGAAGIGKTALALRWAHQVANRFQDGQLYVNMRGFDPSRAPMRPAEALTMFLNALGVAPQAIPANLDAQTTLYRSLLAERRMLVMLDNVRDTEQILPLVPGSPGCLVVITSRSRLTSLIAHAGARSITLDVLTDQEAVTLLTRHLGQDRVAAEPEAVATLIQYCAHLPLALTILAARAAVNSGFPLRVLADELRDEHQRLDSLAVKDEATSVRTVFSWSYRALTCPAANLFRLLGLHPGPDFNLSAAASLASISTSEVRTLLAELCRAHLLSEHVPGRYRFHDLLRTYAAEQASIEDTDEERRAAVHRVLDY